MRIRLVTRCRTRWQRANGDRGAVGVLVAILLGTGVLLGMAAMAVDVGQLYSERAQLQNGADAAALAVATTCSAGTCAPGLSRQYADANAADGTAAVDLVCGTGMGGCPASTGKITDCPPPPASGTNYVDVHTSTLTARGSTLVPPVFARALLGNGHYRGTTVGACAQAEWGASSAALTTSFTVSGCDWAQATRNGTSYGPPPGGGSPAQSDDVVLTLGASAGTGCGADPESTDGPGTFGWTSGSGGGCSAEIQDSSSFRGSNSSTPGSCQQVLAAAQSGHSVLIVPVYSRCSHSGRGGTGPSTYTLKGFAAFVVTGYTLPTSSATDWLNRANTCAQGQTCIDGYFTQNVIPPKSIPSSGCHLSRTTQDLGATWVKLSG